MFYLFICFISTCSALVSVISITVPIYLIYPGPYVDLIHPGSHIPGTLYIQGLILPGYYIPRVLYFSDLIHVWSHFPIIYPACHILRALLIQGLRFLSPYISRVPISQDCIYTASYFLRNLFTQSLPFSDPNNIPRFLYTHGPIFLGSYIPRFPYTVSIFILSRQVSLSSTIPFHCIPSK